MQSLSDIRSIDDVRIYSQVTLRFFAPECMRGFRSRVSESVIVTPDGVYFVTSEKGDRAPRRYTARVLRDDGHIYHAFDADFQQFSTARQAWAYIDWHIKAEVRNANIDNITSVILAASQ